jgi:predicted  nucleic acid-binding Zn-ribbon protein
MTLVTLERRVKALESRVVQLQDELRSVRRLKGKDWRRTIGAYTDDEGMKEVLREAMRLRDADRKKVRSRGATKRSPRQ